MPRKNVFPTKTAHIISGCYSNSTCVRIFFFFNHMTPINNADVVWVTPISSLYYDENALFI